MYNRTAEGVTRKKSAGRSLIPCGVLPHAWNSYDNVVIRAMSVAPASFFIHDVHTILISITSYENKNPAGTLLNTCLAHPVAFHSLADLLFLIDTLLEELDALDLSEHPRVIQNAVFAHARAPAHASGSHASLGVFKLKVLFRQSESWQGSLIWMAGGSEAFFHGILHLIRLMDTALTQPVLGKDRKLSSAEGAL